MNNKISDEIKDMFNNKEKLQVKDKYEEGSIKLRPGEQLWILNKTMELENKITKDQIDDSIFKKKFKVDVKDNVGNTYHFEVFAEVDKTMFDVVKKIGEIFR